MHSFRLRDFHPLRYRFPSVSTKNTSSTSQSYNPDVHAHRFGLFRVRSPLLTESLLVFFSSAYLDVSVQRVCDYCLHVFNMVGCPIRTSTDQRSFAPPRCLTQLTTSFVASGSQGIPHTLLFRFHLLNNYPKVIAKCSSSPAESFTQHALMALVFSSLTLLSLLLLLFPVLSMNSFIIMNRFLPATNFHPIASPRQVQL